MWPVPKKAPHGSGWDREGMQGPRKRMPDMDLEGIDTAVLFGTFIGLGALASMEGAPVPYLRPAPPYSHSIVAGGLEETS